jgi:hypothetical protein
MTEPNEEQILLAKWMLTATVSIPTYESKVLVMSRKLAERDAAQLDAITAELAEKQFQLEKKAEMLSNAAADNRALTAERDEARAQARISDMQRIKLRLYPEEVEKLRADLATALQQCANGAARLEAVECIAWDLENGTYGGPDASYTRGCREARERVARQLRAALATDATGSPVDDFEPPCCPTCGYKYGTNRGCSACGNKASPERGTGGDVCELCNGYGRRYVAISMVRCEACNGTGRAVDNATNEVKNG